MSKVRFKKSTQLAAVKLVFSQVLCTWDLDLNHCDLLTQQPQQEHSRGGPQILEETWGFLRR